MEKNKIRQFILVAITVLSKYRVRQLLSMIIIMLLLVGNGFFWGFWTATGDSPLILLQHNEGYAPPDIQSVDLAGLTDILVEDDTSEQEYREGYNCIDYAWEVMRTLQWQGIDSGIVALTYEDGTRHAILIVPTGDEGWQFIDPQSDESVNPKIGSYYNGKRITEIKVMVIDWIDISEFTDNPVFYEEVSNE